MFLRSEFDCLTSLSLCDSMHSPSHANFHGLAADPDNSGSVFVGTDNGELWHVGADCQWSILADNLPAVLSILPS